jgi:hypothetical protein
MSSCFAAGNREAAAVFGASRSIAMRSDPATCRVFSRRGAAMSERKCL